MKNDPREPICKGRNQIIIVKDIRLDQDDPNIWFASYEAIPEFSFN
jgi:hypothetical protein